MYGSVETRCEACGQTSGIKSSYASAVRWLNQHWTGCDKVLDCGYCGKGHKDFATLAEHVKNECTANPYNRKEIEYASWDAESDNNSSNSSDNSAEEFTSRACRGFL